jgi:hypothetical protein
VIRFPSGRSAIESAVRGMEAMTVRNSILVVIDLC